LRGRKLRGHGTHHKTTTPSLGRGKTLMESSAERKKAHSLQYLR
jgi:hypothetical protein